MILFLAANPRGTDRLALDREARSIDAELKRSGYRDRFDFVTRWAAEPLDLLRELRELKPTVVHFSGHGRTDIVEARGSAGGRDIVDASAPAIGEPHGLYFHDATGGVQVVSPDAIAQAFGAAGASVKLVVLNACFTESIANALLAHVECVVGMSGSIHDDAARSFAIGFYGGLGEHESISKAFEHGRAAISLDGLPDAERPQLKVRDGFDAAQLILAAAAPSLRLDLPCPYPGMQPYVADDAAIFHNRDAEFANASYVRPASLIRYWLVGVIVMIMLIAAGFIVSGLRSIASPRYNEGAQVKGHVDARDNYGAPQRHGSTALDSSAASTAGNSEAEHDAKTIDRPSCGDGINVASCNAITGDSAKSIEIMGTVNINVDPEPRPARAHTP